MKYEWELRGPLSNSDEPDDRGWINLHSILRQGEYIELPNGEGAQVNRIIHRSDKAPLLHVSLADSY